MSVEASIRQWLEQVVIGLNLCPFAKHPYDNARVHIEITQTAREDVLLQTLQEALQHLDAHPEIETTLVVAPNLLTDFEDYNQFLDYIDALLEEFDWVGTYQVATFHPHYQFADTQPEDPENLTNRAPYPVFHLIREASMEAVLSHYSGDPAEIPETNIQRMQDLSESEKLRLFPYLFSKP